MITKLFEVRDIATYIPVMASKMDPSNEAERYLIARAGYGTVPSEQNEYIMLVPIDGGCSRATTDPYNYPTGIRTLREAHKYIKEHFDELENGAVIDIEYIMGETNKPKKSERFWQPEGGM